MEQYKERKMKTIVVSYNAALMHTTVSVMQPG